jgi:hypothetical protein
VDQLQLVLGALTGLGSLICFILIVVKMFQDKKTGAGIASIVLALCCGIGFLIALVVGWQNAHRWNIRNLMIAYTVLLVANIGINAASFPARLQEIQRQMQQQQGAAVPQPAP